MIHQKKFLLTTICLFIICSLILTSVLFLFGSNSNNQLKLNQTTINTLSSNSEVLNSNYSGGTGSKQDPYKISSLQDMVTLSNMVNNEGYSYSNQYFIMTNNIDFSSLTENSWWVPIGVEHYIGVPNETSARAFSGYFDGNGYTVSNLTLYHTFAYNGLFGFIKNATIKNLQIRNVQANFTVDNETYIGAVAGYTKNQCTIENVYVSGINFQVKSDSSAYNVYIGGLIGSFNSTGTYCKSCGVDNITKPTTISNNILFGSLVGGYNSLSDNYIYFEYCYAFGYQFVADAHSSLIEFRYSYYKEQENQSIWYYYLRYHSSPQEVYMLSTFESGFINDSGNISADKWILQGDNYVLKGVGNKSFSNGNVLNATIIYPNGQQVFSLGENPIITINANTDYKLTNVKVYQPVYDNNYNPQGNDFGYFEKNLDTTSYSFQVNDIFTDKARQGHFLIDVNTITTTITTTLEEYIYDITATDVQAKRISTQEIRLTPGQTISKDIVVNSQVPQNYNSQYITEIGLPYYEISGDNTSTEIINTPSFVLTESQALKLKNGATLNVNYTNAYPVNINKNGTTLQYYMASTNSVLYDKSPSQLTFTRVLLTSQSPLIAVNSNTDIKFLGYSVDAPSKPVDYYGRLDNNNDFIGWQPECEMLITAIMENLNETTFDCTISELKVASFDKWNFETIPTLNPVWGGNTVKLLTSVYTFVNNQFNLTPYYNITMNGQVSSNGTFSLEKNSSVNLELQPVINSGAAPLSGYRNIEWFVAEMNENSLDEFQQNGFGVLTEISNLKQTFSGIQKQSSVIAVLQPKTDILLTNIIVNGINENEMPTILFNGQTYENNSQVQIKCIYGNKYSVILENLPKGWIIENVTISNGSQANIDSENNSFTFILSSNDSFDISINMSKGILYNFWIYVLIASAVLLIIICLLIVILRKTNKDENFYIVNQEQIKSYSNYSTDENNQLKEFSNEETQKENETFFNEEKSQNNKKTKKNKKNKNKSSKGEIYEFSYDEDYDSKH